MLEAKQGRAATGCHEFEPLILLLRCKACQCLQIQYRFRPTLTLSCTVSQQQSKFDNAKTHASHKQIEADPVHVSVGEFKCTLMSERLKSHCNCLTIAKCQGK